MHPGGGADNLRQPVHHRHLPPHGGDAGRRGGARVPRLASPAAAPRHRPPRRHRLPLLRALDHALLRHQGVVRVDRRHRWSDVAAVLLAVTGAILIVPQFTLANDIALGMLLATISAFFYATLPLLHQRWSHIATPMRTLGQFAFALLCFSFFIA